MNKRLVIGFFVLVMFVTVGCFSGCKPNPDSNPNISDERNMAPQLAFKGDRTTYNINDVTLTFYCGSENAGENEGENGSYRHSYKEYPVVTYIYFASSKTYARRINKIIDTNNEITNRITFDLVEEFHPNKLYRIIETNENFSVCKKILSTDSNAFYKNNTVTGQYKDVPSKDNTYAAEDAWGKGSALYKASESYTKGVLIPNISYQFTIPPQFFTGSSGYLFFCVASYLTEDYEAASGVYWKEDELLEHRVIDMSYTRNGSDITLSRYYGK